MKGLRFYWRYIRSVLKHIVCTSASLQNLAVNLYSLNLSSVTFLKDYKNIAVMSILALAN